ncbi:flagellar motor switch protein FliG [Klenkia sp. PcliD-1-E]|uniref:flagellar motor switch protein FliG n=1 Tax=Klenkia sp. PcliD-1-E TaxID=2954492 RepID=UPI00209716F5|nr:flagellar motor switch protein FliG [Klenkia sp. PcliD-1-E]MCO7222004.1 flagellar motor switch protein FliG [Klenkia sp. PcliD-1-E]
MTLASVEQMVGLEPGGDPDRAPVRLPRRDLSGLRKAALFLAQMTREEAGAVMAQLTPEEIDALTGELMRLKSVDPADIDDVLFEFHDRMLHAPAVGAGGLEFARQALTAGLGDAEAEAVLGRLQSVYEEPPFTSLRNADTRQLLSFVREEHPQIIALVLAHLPAPQSAELMSRLDPDRQADVALRIAMMDRTTPEVVRLVEDEIGRRMGSLLSSPDLPAAGGVETLVEIINRASRPTEKSILEALATNDPELAERVRSQMFVFEDIVIVDDRSMQLVLREVSPADLAAALKGVRDDVRDKVMRNLSERAALDLTDEIELLGPVRAATVGEAQARVVAVLRTMEESGQITIDRGGDDDLIA